MSDHRDHDEMDPSADGLCAYCLRDSNAILRSELQQARSEARAKAFLEAAHLVAPDGDPGTDELREIAQELFNMAEREKSPSDELARARAEVVEAAKKIKNRDIVPGDAETALMYGALARLSQIEAEAKQCR